MISGTKGNHLGGKKKPGGGPIEMVNPMGKGVPKKLIVERPSLLED